MLCFYCFELENSHIDSVESIRVFYFILKMENLNKLKSELKGLMQDWL